MILETEQEKEAFKFVCELAGLATDRICNDLEDEMIEKLKGCLVDVSDNGKIVQTKIIMDFQVIEWLRNQTNEEN